MSFSVPYYSPFSVNLIDWVEVLRLNQFVSNQAGQFTKWHFSWACLGLYEVDKYLCTSFLQKLTTAFLKSVEGNDWTKKFMINHYERPGGDRTYNLLITRWTCLWLSLRLSHQRWPFLVEKVLLGGNVPFGCLVGSQLRLHFLPNAVDFLEYSYLPADIVLNMILFLQKSDVFFGFVYLFTIYNHQNV